MVASCGQLLCFVHGVCFSTFLVMRSEILSFSEKDMTCSSTWHNCENTCMPKENLKRILCTKCMESCPQCPHN